jgi:hypothetical protein
VTDMATAAGMPWPASIPLLRNGLTRNRDYAVACGTEFKNFAAW